MTIITVPSIIAPTISLAISIASPGDIINVLPGTYTEHVIVNVPNLTLNGAQANIDARTRKFIPAVESIITLPGVAIGTGVINVTVPNVVINGFTVQANISPSSAGIFAGDVGQFLPSTTTLDVTGLQILNCIIQNNANGIMVASIESTPNPINYLISQCYFYNNSGDPGVFDGQGVYFNNNAGLLMTNIVVQNNLFNGLETSASISLGYVSGGLVTNNVMNQDNAIVLAGTNNVTITNNISYQATGITSTFSNTASAMYITNNIVDTVTIYNTNLIISNNLIYNATNDGITIMGASDVAGAIMITGNCIVGNTISGIHFTGPASSGVTINNNNISQNTIGLLLDAGSYIIPPLLNATNNYWNSPSGPNYNSGGPGTGDSIIDNNIPSTVSVSYTPFLTTAIICPFTSALTLTKTTSSIDIKAGNVIFFNIVIVVPSTVPISITSFVDNLPVTPYAWAILSQSAINLFTINGAIGAQTLNLTPALPIILPPGTYTVTLYAKTDKHERYKLFPNTATITFQLDGISALTQTISSTAIASIMHKNKCHDKCHRDKCHRDKCHRNKCHRDKCHHDKCYCKNYGYY